jgi:hypothetical protein
LINGLGAIATAVLLAIIASTKFLEGAWIVIALMPVAVVALLRLHKQYERERVELELDLAAFEPPAGRAPIAILLVDDLDPKTVHALQYARTIRVDRVIAVHVEETPERTRDLQRSWQTAGLGEIPLRVIRGSDDQAASIAGFLAAYQRDDRDVIVIVPVPHTRTARARLSDSRMGARLDRALLPYPNVRVTLVRDHPDGVHPLQRDAEGRPVVRLATRGLHEVVILVDTLDRATLQAIEYSMDLGATSIRAVHAAADPDRAARLVDRWTELSAPVPLDVIECWDRDIPRALERYVVGLARETRTLGRYAHVDIADVPYSVRTRREAPHREPVLASD